MALTSNPEIFLVVIILAILLDAVMGDPRWLPHPVRIIGKGIELFERVSRRFGKGKVYEFTAGAVLAIVTAGSVFIMSFALQDVILTRLSGPARLVGIACLVYLASSTIACNDLIRSGSSVISAVLKDDIEEARQRLRMIVGRDVDSLDRDGILRAVIETLSENLSDGVVAPLLYLAVGGVPCALTYKAINTLDSMVGYKNDRFLYFGRVSARLDDIVNYIPARISGVLIALASSVLFRSARAASLAFSTMASDGRNHSSPNSGYPEAAAAGALGVRLGGPTSYGGIILDKPFIGAQSRADYLEAGTTALSLVRLSSYIAFLLTVCIIFILVKF